MLAILDLRCSIWWASFSDATAELLIPCASKSGSFLSTLDLVCLMRIVRAVRLTMAIQRKLKAPILSAFLNFALPPRSEAHSKLSSSLPKVKLQAFFIERFVTGDLGSMFQTPIDPLVEPTSVCLEDRFDVGGSGSPMLDLAGLFLWRNR
ncbi:hypothetical protein SLEP1_g42387 [Rubroshorea leprosula]|uniref:Uncharacterized protein n=1 Tax=Rubroshorea leprosula TaxID=152421 RepID=A0AAV5L9M5_9ROSI|nr:hypothetical protein SLEP1_g42387 [Rubroshorea leprosula]